MRRDDDLIRALLLHFQAKPTDEMSEEIIMEGYSDLNILYHVRLMCEAGFLTYEASRTDTGRLIKCYPFSLTWDGHEFARLMESDTIWKKVKGKFAEQSIGVVWEVAKGVALTLIKTQAGIA
jgi:hypothetical protein